MIRVTTGGEPESVLQAAKHVLFVEGENDESFDVKVLEELFDFQITVKPLGPSYSLKSVATALHPHHPDYYFLIDRDPHHSDDDVEKYWSNFPDPASHNLLIWRRREIENYFIEPMYLRHSRFCRTDEAGLIQTLIQAANQRLYLDVANHVIVAIRETQKREWIKLFKDPKEFKNAAFALEKLKSRPEFSRRLANVEASVSSGELERLFNEILQRMTGGQDELTLGHGKWLDLIQGKAVLAHMVNSACFEVRTNAGELLQGRDKTREIVKDLLRQGSKIEHPRDFLDLKALVLKRIQAA